MRTMLDKERFYDVFCEDNDNGRIQSYISSFVEIGLRLQSLTQFAKSSGDTHRKACENTHTHGERAETQR